MKKAIVISTMFLITGQAFAQNIQSISNLKNMTTTEAAEYYTFKLSDKVTRQKVSFSNRYGITLSADLYTPKNSVVTKLPALAISGPFGAVKQQSSGLYAPGQQLRHYHF